MSASDGIQVHWDAACDKALHPAIRNICAAMPLGVVAVKPLSNVTTHDNTLTGAAVYVTADSLLSDVAPYIGDTIFGRIGVYDVAPEGPVLTASELRRTLDTKKVADFLDDSGDNLPAFSHTQASGQAWQAKLDNGAGSNNVCGVYLQRGVGASLSELKPKLIVETNATPQGRALIQASLAAKSDMTVGEFIQQPSVQRVSQLSDEQNFAVAARFSDLTGLVGVSIVDSSSRSSNDEFAAPVRHAVPESLARFGELRMQHDGTIKLTNNAVDIHASTGTTVPVRIDPLSGYRIYQTISPQSTPLHKVDPSTGAAVAVALPVTKLVKAQLAPHVGAKIRESLFWRGKSVDASVHVEALHNKIARVNASLAVFNVDAIKNSGLSPTHYASVDYEPMAAVVVP